MNKPNTDSETADPFLLMVKVWKGTIGHEPMMKFISEYWKTIDPTGALTE